MIRLILQKPDTFGALASTMCVIHCLATPLLFITHSCALNSCNNSPSWWSNLDYVFLIISLLAITQSFKNSSKAIIKVALLFNWLILGLLTINEKTQLIILSETYTHVVALTLTMLHIYNMMFCKCKATTCNH